MYSIAKLSDEKRNLIFTNVEYESGINRVIIEKDYWVTIVLDYLFNISDFKDYFIFKGGTSLSKCFNLINRFSEDIDLILNWEILEIENPYINRTRTKQEKFNKQINSLCADFIKDKLKPELEKYFCTNVNENCVIEILPEDPQTLLFYYPKLYNDLAGVLDHIRIEIGPLAALSPTENISISPIVCKYFNKEYEKIETNIITILPQRTFWEKILILHQIFYKPKEKKIPLRYSRHYYDVYKIAHSDYKRIAFNQLDLLEEVRNFKNKFYPSTSARYDLAKLGSLKLVPSKERIIELESDFKEMKEMIYDDEVSFLEIIEYLKALEVEINKLK